MSSLARLPRFFPALPLALILLIFNKFRLQRADHGEERMKINFKTLQLANGGRAARPAVAFAESSLDNLRHSSDVPRELRVGRLLKWRKFLRLFDSIEIVLNRRGLFINSLDHFLFVLLLIRKALGRRAGHRDHRQEIIFQICELQHHAHGVLQKILAINFEFRDEVAELLQVVQILLRLIDLVSEIKHVRLRLFDRLLNFISSSRRLVECALRALQVGLVLPARQFELILALADGRALVLKRAFFSLPSRIRARHFFPAARDQKFHAARCALFINK